MDTRLDDPELEPRRVVLVLHRDPGRYAPHLDTVRDRDPDYVVGREGDAAATRALAAPKPGRDAAELWVFSPDVDPTSPAFATEAQPQGEAAR